MTSESRGNSSFADPRGFYHNPRRGDARRDLRPGPMLMAAGARLPEMERPAGARPWQRRRDVSRPPTLSARLVEWLDVRGGVRFW